MPSFNYKTSIIAGNPLFDDKEGGSKPLDLQLRAFEKAIEFASEIRDQVGRIYIAVDHVGRFDRFLKPGLSSKRRKKPRGSDLNYYICKEYQLICDNYGFNLEDLHIATEFQARAGMKNVIKDGPVELSAIFTFGDSQINCRGIAAEFLRRVVAHGDRLEAFVEQDEKRCRIGTFQTAAMVLDSHLGIQKPIRISMWNGNRWTVIADNKY